MTPTVIYAALVLAVPVLVVITLTAIAWADWHGGSRS
jgi:hypothetical protein